MDFVFFSKKTTNPGKRWLVLLLRSGTMMRNWQKCVPTLSNPCQTEWYACKSEERTYLLSSDRGSGCWHSRKRRPMYAGDVVFFFSELDFFVFFLSPSYFYSLVIQKSTDNIFSKNSSIFFKLVISTFKFLGYGQTFYDLLQHSDFSLFAHYDLPIFANKVSYESSQCQQHVNFWKSNF